MILAAGLPPSGGMFIRSCKRLEMGVPLLRLDDGRLVEFSCRLVVIKDSTNSSGNPSVFAILFSR